MDIQSQLLNMHQVAKRMNCSERTIARMVGDGVMPRNMKIGGMRRFDAEKLEQWIANGCLPVRREGGAS
jgi:excisionase family DNA binding protein